MKALIATIFFALVLTACDRPTAYKDPYDSGVIIDSIGYSHIRVYEFDSCEYIGILTGTDHDWCTHKGNCKYCAKRNNPTR